MRLNPLQQHVVENWNKPLLVMAPVGTGKTMALAARAAAAIAGGLDPARMLCLSFTNRAAREVASRIGDHVECSTFHALCALILRAEARVLGLPSDFVIYDEEDCVEACSRLAQKYQIEFSGSWPKLCYTLWTAISDGRLARYESSEKPREVFERRIRESGLWAAYRQPELHFPSLAADYVAMLRDSHALDFPDLILGVATLFEENPDRLAWWRCRYDWIQVDEVQDTSRAEYRILDSLAREHRQLSFFGDVDQTIYEWRGSAPQEILSRYKHDYRPEVIHFEENFRSTRRILEACEKVIVSHPQALTKRIIAKVQREGEPVLVRPFVTAREEYDWIAGQIRADHEGHKLDWRDIAVLVRTNHTARDISEALERAGVPHVRVEEEKFFQRAEIKAAIAHLRILRSNQESSGLLRFLQVPPKGIGEATLAKVSSLPREVGLRLGDMLLPGTHEQGEPFAALLTKPAVVADCETTGLDLSVDEVVELAALKGEEEFHRILRPTRPETWARVEDAASIHGVTRERIEAEGVEPEQAFAEFAEFVRGHVVVGHNLETYDWPLIRRQSQREFAIAGTGDTLEISRRLLKLPRYRLENVVGALGLPLRTAHQAMEDVRMTADVLGKLREMLARHSEERRRVVAQAGKRFVELAGQVADWRERSRKQSPAETLDMVLYEGLLLEYFGRDEDGEARLEHLEELRRIVGRMSSLDEALEVASLGLDLERQLGEEDRVRILTVHQSKGLEFDTVFVARAVEGEFPSWRSLKENRLDEEHRLFYVAISRARERLYVTWQQRDGRGRSQVASRYLKALRVDN
ncbi:MAG: 3'-5' exonuclease [Acidobacteriota bacterium]